MEVPHVLSNPAGRFITERSAHSIFGIRSSPRGVKFDRDLAAQAAYVQLVRRVMSNKNRKKSDNWSTVDKKLGTATGFAYEKPTDRILILTAAHTILEAYSEEYPLDNTHLATLNQAYYFEVICIHKGREFLLGDQDPGEDISESYLPASIVGINSALDLMVLQVDTARLSLICSSEHSTINGIAKLPPPTAEPVLLHGWPDKRCDTTVWGNVGTERGYRWLTRNNPQGYKMRLLELPGLECEAGCSGGPLVDGRLKCVGVCNANLNHCGYAVSVHDVQSFLISCGLMVDDDDAPALADDPAPAADSADAPAADPAEAAAASEEVPKRNRRRLIKKIKTEEENEDEDEELNDY